MSSIAQTALYSAAEYHLSTFQLDAASNEKIRQCVMRYSKKESLQDKALQLTYLVWDYVKGILFSKSDWILAQKTLEEKFRNSIPEQFRSSVPAWSVPLLAETNLRWMIRLHEEHVEISPALRTFLQSLGHLSNFSQGLNSLAQIALGAAQYVVGALAGAART